MFATHERRTRSEHGERQKSTGTTNDSYSHSSRGFAHWLEVAPKTASFTEVVEAYKQHETPHDVWDSGPNHRLTEYGGETR